MAALDLNAFERRRKSQTDTAEHYNGRTHFYDPRGQVNVIKIFSGQWHVSTQKGDMLATILGSCVSACIRDPVAGIGGMNHFLLPGDDRGEVPFGESARYGVHAMESLINGILKAGGQKSRFEIKVFGGGNVINNSARIGSKNANFIREFLRKEGFAIASEDLEGDHPRRLHYYPDTGKVMLRALKRREDNIVLRAEADFTKQIAAHPVEGEIELF